MSKKWTDEQRELLEWSIKSCSKFTVIAPTYDVSIYQRRNQRMVDLSDMVAAFWDGSSGGTGNCVRYAQKVKKPMVRFSDFSGTVVVEKEIPSFVPSAETQLEVMRAKGMVLSADTVSSPDSAGSRQVRSALRSEGRSAEVGPAKRGAIAGSSVRTTERFKAISSLRAEVIVNSVNCVGVMGKAHSS